jgi:hypothetical protein
MKTTIKIALIAICFFAINSTANAQSGKVYRPRTTAPATNIPVVVAVKDTPTTQPLSTAVTQINQPKLDALVQLATKQKPLPKQDPTKAMATGTIKIEADELVSFGEENHDYFITLTDVKENPEYQNNSGGLVGMQYSFGLGNATSYINDFEIVLKKVNAKEYKYDIYNIPTKTRFAIALSINLKGYNADRVPDRYTQRMAYLQVENAYYMYKDYSNTNIATNFKYDWPIPTLNTAPTLPTIVIKNPLVQPN